MVSEGGREGRREEGREEGMNESDQRRAPSLIEIEASAGRQGGREGGREDGRKGGRRGWITEGTVINRIKRGEGGREGRNNC